MSTTNQRTNPIAHTATVVELPNIIEFLRENLGVRLLAVAVGVAPETVTRWSTQARTPQPDHEERLRHTYAVFQHILTVDAAPTARAWFMGMNPQLDDYSPAEAIRDGRHREVMAAARAFVQGA